LADKTKTPDFNVHVYLGEPVVPTTLNHLNSCLCQVAITGI